MKKLVTLVFILTCSISYGATHLLNTKDLQRKFGISSYVLSSKVQRSLPSVKVAVLDNGFGDLGQNFSEVSTYLPVSTQVIEYYPKEMNEKFSLNPSFKGNPLSSSQHGLMMAQIVWSLSGSLAKGPQFYLLNANGYTNFTRAVRYAIEQDVDIILYSQNWEYGGNFDGKGFINKVVNDATSAGILWVNAAGNYAGKVWNSKITLKDGNILKLKNGDDKVEFEVGLDENTSTLTVAWQDFFNDSQKAATTDLDIDIVDVNGKVHATSNLSQVNTGADDKRKPTLYAREKVSFKLDKGRYFIKVKYVSGDVGSKNIRLYLNSENEGAKISNILREQEVMIPADNPNVITVGDNSIASAMGPTLDNRSKPDLIMPESLATFSSGLTTSGTSNAAAYYAGVLSVLKAFKSNLSKSDLLSSSASGYEKTLREVSKRKLPINIQNILGKYLDKSKFYLLKSGRLKIVLPVSPLALSPYYDSIYRDMSNNSKIESDYHFFIGTNGLQVKGYYQPVGWDNVLPQFWIELTGPTKATRLYSVPEL